MKHLIRFLGILLFCLTQVHAELHWSSLIITLPAKLGEDCVQGSFIFENNGIQPVTITSLKPSCGCTTVISDKNTVAPGEKGTLQVTMDTTKFSGFQEKSIQVFTDDTPGNPTSLTIRTTIPTALDITPRLLWWTIGSEKTEKEVIVLTNQDAQVQVQSVSVDNNTAFITSLEKVEKGKSYRIRVRPLSTQNSLQTMVRVIAEVPGAASRNSAFIVQVR